MSRSITALAITRLATVVYLVLMLMFPVYLDVPDEVDILFHMDVMYGRLLSIHLEFLYCRFVPILLYVQVNYGPYYNTPGHRGLPGNPGSVESSPSTGGYFVEDFGRNVYSSPVGPPRISII